MVKHYGSVEIGDDVYIGGNSYIESKVAIVTGMTLYGTTHIGQKNIYKEL